MTQHLLDAGNSLAEVLMQENAALKRLDFPAAVALVAAKEAALLRVTAARPLPLTKPSAVLTALGRRLTALAAENRTLLERAIQVQTRVAGIIVRAATPPPESRQYAPGGGTSQPRRASAVALLSRA